MASSINFAALGGPVYVGRPNGERAREKLELDRLDASSEPVAVDVPEGTYSINSSYFLGMFGPSVVKFGSEQSFLDHYKFSATPAHMESIRRHVERALREKGILKLS